MGSTNQHFFCQKIESLTTESEKLKKELKETFPEVFSVGLGRCKKMSAKFELNENIQPIFKKKEMCLSPRWKKINEKLDRLSRTSILSKVEYSQWAAPTVDVKKSKEIRVCADFSTGLNAALKDYHYSLPSPEVFAKLNGGKFFSKIDLGDAYFQIPFEEESSKLRCIYTHCGLNKFERLASGAKVAPAIFQQIMDTMLGELDFTIAYLDDILINSKTMIEHWGHVHSVFSQIQDYGFKIKESKRDFFMKEIKYLGHIIDKDSRKLDPERVAVIKNMPAPENVASLQSFLGLANYYQAFIPSMHNLRAPLIELLRKDKAWE